MINDTIAAIATANAMGAVSMIRISGSEAIEIAGKLKYFNENISLTDYILK